MKRLLPAILATLTMSGCGGGGGGGTVSIPPPILVSISPSTQTNVDQGQSVKFTAAVDNDASSKGVTWSASAAGLTAAACGTFTNSTTSSATYNAPATVSANTSITITATSATDPTKAASAMVIVSPPPRITTAALTNATPNANYSATLQASGGVGTFTWSLVGGALPAGLALSGSGAIAGDPTVSGTFPFTVQVADSSTAPGGPVTSQAQLNLTVVTALTTDTTALPAASAGVTYLAAIDANGGTPPYVWSVTSGSLPPGVTMQPDSGVISGDPTSQGTFTFAVALQDSSPIKQTQTQNLAIAVGAPGTLAITTSAFLDGTVSTAYNAKLAALGGTPPYAWSIAAGALPASLSLNSLTGAIAGTASQTGTAYFTVMVQDAGPAPSTQTQALSITIDDAPEACDSSGNNAVLSGSYAFNLSGYTSTGFVTVVGSFTADGTGKITAGEADTNGVLGALQGNLSTTGSSYSVGPDNRGCATLATSFGTFVTRFTLGAIASNVATAGRMIEWASPSTSAYVASGQLLRQTASSFAGGLSGSYVTHSLGWDTSSQGGRDACVGAISVSGHTLNAFEQDCNDAWTISTIGAPDIAGTYTSPDANGRGAAILAMPASNANFVFYMVSGAQLMVLTADPYPFQSGEWDAQNMPQGGAGFTAASLKGNMVFSLSGLSLDGTASAISTELANADGVGSMAITFYQDRAGNLEISSTLACSYAVEPNGRVTLSSNAQSCGGAPPVFYLQDVDTGFIVDASPGVDTGSIEPQSAGPFTNASLSGNFFAGVAEVVSQNGQPELDAISPNGSGSVSGLTDMSFVTAQDAGMALPAATYTVNSDGTLNLSSSDGAIAGIIISSSKFLVFSPSTWASSYPALLVVQK